VQSASAIAAIRNAGELSFHDAVEAEHRSFELLYNSAAAADV
jgi:hypothetical protein